MNESIKKKWITALTSGEYKQATYRLRKQVTNDTNEINEYQYCCLGVLCELYRKDTGRGEWLYDAYFKSDPGLLALNSQLPRTVLQWAELDDAVAVHNDPLREYDDYYSMGPILAPGLPFVQIAELIENYL